MVSVLYTSLRKPNPNFSLQTLQNQTGLVLTNNGSNIASFNNQLQAKQLLKNYASHPNTEKVFEWIICTWGGINKARFDVNTISNYAKMYSNSNSSKVFLDKIYNNSMHCANNVASWSKVASFMYPNECYIYDSRVPFVLNILLEKSEYPVPVPSNTTIKQFNTRPNKSPSRKQYEDYCRTIELIHNQLYKGTVYANQKYVTEMLLFSLLSYQSFICTHINNNNVYPRRINGAAPANNGVAPANNGSAPANNGSAPTNNGAKKNTP